MARKTKRLKELEEENKKLKAVIKYILDDNLGPISTPANNFVKILSVQSKH